MNLRIFMTASAFIACSLAQAQSVGFGYSSNNSLQLDCTWMMGDQNAGNPI